MPIELSLLGGFAVDHHNIPITGFRTDKIRALFAYLVTEVNRPHRRETLAALFWPDMSDNVAKRNLRQSLHRLKQAVALPTPWLEMTRQTVLIRKDAITSDIDRFQKLLQNRQTRAYTSDTQIRHLEDAIDLYQGEFLQGLFIDNALTFMEWLRVQREHYHHQALLALQDLTTLLLERNDNARAHVYAQRQLALEPWHESAHRQAIIALIKQGKRAAALMQLERCRTVLWDELGLEIAAETSQLAQQLLTHQPVSSPPVSQLHNFPVQLTPFVGRTADITALITYLSQPDCRLLTLIAVGGMGKTRLILKTAETIAETTTQFPDGIYFVSLAALNNPDVLSRTIGVALGLIFTTHTTAHQQLLTYLKSRRCLLILDNFEQINVAKTVLHAILEAAPHVKLVVTSRQTLNLHAEQRFLLSGLVETEAVELFLQVARRTHPLFVYSAEHQPHLQRICTLTDGMPLALEMAASWTRLLSCAQIADQIAEQNARFLDDPLDLPARHRSLQAVFDRSWLLLNAAEQKLFLQLAVFHDGATLAAMLAVTHAGALPIAGLLDKSLLQRDSLGRFRLHHVLRQVVAPQLSETSHQRHAAYFMQWLHDRTLQGGDQQHTLSEIEVERHNIEAAWRWAVSQRDAELIAQGVVTLFHFYDMRNHFQEGCTLFQLAADAMRSEPQLHARITARLGWFYFHLGQAQRSQHALQDSLHHLREGPHTIDTIFALNYVGAFFRHQNDFVQAKQYLQEARVLAKQIDDLYGLTIALNILGQIALLEQAYAVARTFCQQSLELKRAIGDAWGMSFSFGYLGRVAYAEEKFVEAESFFRQCMLISERFGDRRMVAFAFENRGNIAAARKQTAQADRLWQKALVLYQEIGSVRDVLRLQYSPAP